MHFFQKPTLPEGSKGEKVYCRTQKVQSVPGFLATIVVVLELFHVDSIGRQSVCTYTLHDAARVDV